ncbi:hypothetical protein EV360DRAFT_90824 [Lentinula raphanica]|nr:hypothetical protein EV360DRAFT_90824 [Lentinula raphanica]
MEPTNSRPPETMNLPGHRRHGLKSQSTLSQIPLFGSRARPICYLAWAKANERLDEEWGYKFWIICIHATFSWGGLKMPKDCLWFTLRNRCPSLKTLYTNIGYEPHNFNSTKRFLIKFFKFLLLYP